MVNIGPRPERDHVRRFATDRYGRQTLIRRPNVPLLAWAGFGLVSRTALSDDVQRISRFLSGFSLLVWALLEITKGESPVRRMMGTAALAVMAHRCRTYRRSSR